MQLTQVLFLYGLRFMCLIGVRPTDNFVVSHACDTVGMLYAPGLQNPVVLVISPGTMFSELRVESVGQGMCLCTYVLIL
jgi:hypothetical protein